MKAASHETIRGNQPGRALEKEAEVQKADKPRTTDELVHDRTYMAWEETTVLLVVDWGDWRPYGWFDCGAKPILRLRWILRRGYPSYELTAA